MGWRIGRSPTAYGVDKMNALNLYVKICCGFYCTAWAQAWNQATMHSRILTRIRCLLSSLALHHVDMLCLAFHVIQIYNHTWNFHRLMKSSCDWWPTHVVYACICSCGISIKGFDVKIRMGQIQDSPSLDWIYKNANARTSHCMQKGARRLLGDRYRLRWALTFYVRWALISIQFKFVYCTQNNNRLLHKN